MNSDVLESLASALELYEMAIQEAMVQLEKSNELQAKLERDPGNILVKNDLQMCIGNMKAEVDSAESSSKILLRFYEDYADEMPEKYRRKIEEQFPQEIIFIEAKKVAQRAAPPPKPRPSTARPAPAIKPHPKEIKAQIKAAMAAEQGAKPKTLTEAQILCPWIPIAFPAKRRMEMPTMDAEVTRFYNESLAGNEEWQKRFKILAEFFFFIYFECNIAKWRPSSFGPVASAAENWITPNILARARYEAALAWQSAMTFLKDHEKSPVDEQFDDAMIWQLRARAQRQIDFRERKMIGQEAKGAHREELQRHVSQAEQHLEEWERQLEEAKSISKPSMIPIECKEINRELLNKLKSQQLEQIDCNHLVNMHDNLKKHNSRKTAEKILHRDLILDLKQVISACEVAKSRLYEN